MGAEAQCTVRFGRNVSEGKALLETDVLLFRGQFPLAIPLKDVSSVQVDGGQLRVAFSEGTAIFELGPLAEKWAHSIRNPKSLVDKLGIKPESYVAIVGIKDSEFRRQIRDRARNIARGRPRRELDFLFLGAETRAQLTQLEHLQEFLKPDGAIWVVWPKGRPDIKDGDVIRAAKEAGLVDVKVVKFSETHSALKLVIPVSRR